MASNARLSLVIFAVASCMSYVIAQQAAVQPAEDNSMTFRQARRVLESAAPTQEQVRFFIGGDSLNMRGSLIDYRSKTHVQDISLPLNEIMKVEGYPGDGIWAVDIYLTGNRTRFGDYRFHWLASKDMTAQQDSTRFAEALKWMVSHTADLPGPKAMDAAADMERFKEEAATWRAASIKPAMPDEAHVHQVLAENAVREKNLDKAMDEYEAALDIFPTWPDGQNNLAFLCGESGDYECAIEHAQEYLELVPNATDAQAVKDKIIIWKDKLKGGGY